MASLNDNITYRKPCRSSSLINLSNITNGSEKAIFDTTMMSIPDSLHDNSDIMGELNEQIKNLTNQLASAHNEIENLNIENFRLKSDLQKMIKTAKTYNEICSSPCRKPISPLHNKKTRNRDKEQSSRSINETSISDKQINCSKTTSIMHNKETQTTHTPEKFKEVPTILTLSENMSNNNNKKPVRKITKPRQKNKLCILSSSTTKGSLSTIQEVYSNHSHYCHYIKTNSSASGLLSDIELKLKGFMDNDYCILFIGENDINEEGDHINKIHKIRTCLQKVNHTNIIICAATYVAGAPIYNFKAETFNNLLYLDIQNNEYAYFFDSNRDLSLDMFSYGTGKITNYGMRNIHDRIISNILYDLDLFNQADQTTVTNKLEDDGFKNHDFFRV